METSVTHEIFNGSAAHRLTVPAAEGTNTKGTLRQARKAALLFRYLAAHACLGTLASAGHAMSVGFSPKGVGAATHGGFWYIARQLGEITKTTLGRAKASLTEGDRVVVVTVFTEAASAFVKLATVRWCNAVAARRGAK